MSCYRRAVTQVQESRGQASFTAPELAYKVYVDCKYVPDPTKDNFEIVENWSGRPVDERSLVLQFLRHSGPQFLHEDEYRLNDLAQRLKARSLTRNQVVKNYGQATE